MTLEIDNVELYFNKKRILFGIYLKAQTGKTTGLLGRNGCGKSCLLKILFGDLQPKYKLVRLDKKPFTKPLYFTKLISYLPQHNFTPNSLRIKRAFKLYDVSWTDFINKFKAFDIYFNTRFHELSGGERRLIETYLILKKNSKIVLLDEPFSHLSPLHIESIKQIIYEEQKNDKAIIITDHMYKHIIDTCDSIYLLNGGQSKLINDLIELEYYKYLSLGKLDTL